MHGTIAALYKDGRIIPQGEKIPVSEAKVLVTFLDEKRRADGGVWKEKDLEVQDVSLRREASGFYQGRCLVLRHLNQRQHIQKARRTNH